MGLLSYFVLLEDFHSQFVTHMGGRKKDKCWNTGLIFIITQTFSGISTSLPPLYPLLSGILTSPRLTFSGKIIKGTSGCSLSLEREVYNQWFNNRMIQDHFSRWFKENNCWESVRNRSPNECDFNSCSINPWFQSRVGSQYCFSRYFHVWVVCWNVLCYLKFIFLFFWGYKVIHKPPKCLFCW